MNKYSPVASGGNTADAANIRAFLQQAVDHYPRLVAFSFTLKLPHRETLSEYRSLILRFHTEVWQRTGEYSRQCQQALRHSPPTVLRWIWEAASAPECKMVLMMNLDIVVKETLTDGTVIQDMDVAQRVMSQPLQDYPPLFREAIGYLYSHGTMTLVVPPELAYGEKGYPPKVPPGATMVYELRVNDVKPGSEEQ